jgi:hypothetical protein
MGNLYLITFIERFVPLGINVEIHSFVGFCMLFHSIGHVFAHISYEYIRTSGGPRATVTQKSLTNGGWDYRYTGSGDGITGYILLGIILFMSITALLRGQTSNFYKLFSNFHVISYHLWLVFLYLHVYHLWPWWLAIVVLYVGDTCYDLLFLTTVTTLAHSRVAPDGVTYVSLHASHVISSSSSSLILSFLLLYYY